MKKKFEKAMQQSVKNLVEAVKGVKLPVEV